MNRRGFLGAILATACAPAIVRADALMRIVPREAIALGDLSWPPLAGGYLYSEDLRKRLLAQLYDADGRIVASGSFDDGARLLFPMIAGATVTHISISGGGQTLVLSPNDCIGLPITPNGGNIIVCR